MLRSSLVASAAVLLCATASAQQTRAGVQTAKLKHGGVYNMQTGKFHKAGQGAMSAVQQNVYNNTCSAAAPGVFLLPTTACEDSIDIGRVPTGGVGPNHATNEWEIGYCTTQAAGAVDIDWELVNTSSLGGSTCTFAVPPAPAFTNPLVGLNSSAAVPPFPLPGSTNGGFACWALTFTGGTFTACLDAGALSTDQFSYRLRSNAVGLNGAFIIAGDPILNVPGTGTFSNPMGTDIAGGDCGTGLDNTDDIWGNTDNTAIGGTPPNACLVQGAYPTGCFGFFPGFPTAPWASMYFRIAGDGACAGACDGTVSFYCTAKTNSKGCVPVLSTSGFPTKGFCGSQVFNLTASQLIGQKNGQWYYSGVGPGGAPFLGGHLCVGKTVKRLPVQGTGGAGSTCNGVMTTNFNSRICGGTDPQLTAGKSVWAQAQHRDNPSTGQISLTSGVTFTICP